MEVAKAKRGKQRAVCKDIFNKTAKIIPRTEEYSKNLLFNILHALWQ